MNKINIVFLLLTIVLIVSCEDPNSPESETWDFQEYNTGYGWTMETGENGELWVSNDAGIAYYSPVTDSWTQLSDADMDLLANDMGPIMVDGDDVWIGYGWAGTDTDDAGLGVSHWDRSTDQIVHYGSAQGTSNFPSGPVWDIEKHPDGTVYAGTRFDSAAAYFDGTSWTQFPIEVGELYDADYAYMDCNTIKFSANRGFFETYRGGLHVYDFEQAQWIYSDRGADSGTDSFFRRGFSSGSIAVVSDSEVYLATNGNLADASATGDTPDGIWHITGMGTTNVFTNISPADYEEGANTGYLVVDGDGSLWAWFEQDYSMRYWDGSDWVSVSIDGIAPSESHYIFPMLYSGDGYLWAGLRTESGSVVTREILRITLP